MSKKKNKPRPPKRPIAPDNSSLKILKFLVTVSRRDVLVSELDTAIRLWFLKGDPVAVHVLVMAAYQCLRDLSGVKETMVAPAYDWFRHASSEFGDRMDFMDENGRFIWESTELFDRLFGGLTPYMRTFQAYFFHRGTWLSPDLGPNSGQLLPKGFKLGEVRYIPQAEFFRKLTKAFAAEDSLPVEVREPVNNALGEPKLAPDFS